MTTSVGRELLLFFWSLRGQTYHLTELHHQAGRSRAHVGGWVTAAGEEGPGKHQQCQDFRPKRLATQVLCCDVRAFGCFYLSGSFRYGRDRDEKLPGPNNALTMASLSWESTWWDWELPENQVLEQICEGLDLDWVNWGGQTYPKCQQWVFMLRASGLNQREKVR